MAKTQFKSESKRLLDLMINSIYTHKEIFLREIISNANDAIDKLCFLSLTDDKVGMSREDFYIRITADEQNRLLTISDNGIGMDDTDLDNNLGTIACSGSKKFREQLTEENKDDVSIIGQFGVGFYSAFMVADEITVITKKYGSDKAYKWVSDGADGYEITECQKDTVGTDIIIKIKEDTEDEKYSEFLKKYRITSLVKKYSDYIRYPIKMETETQKLKDGCDPENQEYETVFEDKTLNSMVPIWQKAKKDVTKEEYDQFYKDKFFDMEAPLHTIVTSVEGVVTYKALLYIPSKAPYNYYTREFEKGLQLYCNGVLIMENCPDLLPEHFRFVRGVVDSADLSLNISREMLQHDRQLKLIADALEKKIKNELTSLMKKDRETYEKMFRGFGTAIKYGLVSDYGMHKDNLKELVMFNSSNEGKLTTLAEYVGRMNADQKYIYFALGDSVSAINNLPQTEILKDKGYEYLCCVEEIDEFALQILHTYADKEFRSVLNDDLGIEQEEKPAEEKETQTEVIKFIADVLGDKVSEVTVSNKLKSHAVCLTAKGGVSFEMEKYFSQIQPDSNMKAQKVLELNMEHNALKKLQSEFTVNKDRATKMAKILYNQALLIAGLPIENPTEYASLVCDLF